MGETPALVKDIVSMFKHFRGKSDSLQFKTFSLTPKQVPDDKGIEFRFVAAGFHQT